MIALSYRLINFFRQFINTAILLLFFSKMPNYFKGFAN